MRKIQTGDAIKVNYTGKLEDGTIFDSSLNEGRTPLEITVGSGQLITGFENALHEMIQSEKKVVEIEPEEGYGPYRSEMVFDIPKNQFPENVKSGDVLNSQSSMGPVTVTVVEVKDEHIKIDANHPLAGKKLIFELEIMEFLN
jgi:FKBP-type peptidyl-prolyl cis-trans isomerase 2